MKVYTQLRNNLCFDRADAVEVMTKMRDEDDSFEVNDYLFVHEDQIVKYLADYLSNDEYSLGCFADWFISSQTGIDQGAIAAMQAEEAFEACSKLILSICDMKEFAQFAISTDGAGHFLSRYDGSEKQIGSYLAFRQN